MRCGVIVGGIGAGRYNEALGLSNSHPESLALLSRLYHNQAPSPPLLPTNTPPPLRSQGERRVGT